MSYVSGANAQILVNNHWADFCDALSGHSMCEKVTDEQL